MSGGSTANASTHLTIKGGVASRPTNSGVLLPSLVDLGHAYPQPFMLRGKGTLQKVERKKMVTNETSVTKKPCSSFQLAIFS